MIRQLGDMGCVSENKLSLRLISTVVRKGFLGQDEQANALEFLLFLQLY